MNTALIYKIQNALEKLSGVESIDTREIDLRLPKAILTNKVDDRLDFVDIPVDTNAILINETGNKRNAVNLLVSFFKNEGQNISLSVIEIINNQKWKYPQFAVSYLKEREKWVESSSAMHLGHKNISKLSNVLHLHYMIEIDIQNLEEIAVIIEKLKSSVTKSAQKFNHK